MRMIGLFRALVVPVLLAGCAHRAASPVAMAPSPSPSMPTAAMAMPAGASPGMTIPTRLLDGTYPTPSLGLSRAAAIWHLRVALNVAALACRGSIGDAIAARYNALLSSRRAAFATAQTAAIQEVRVTGVAKPQDAWDGDMTRLYNYYALAPARDGFCAAADRVLAALPAIAADDLARYAPIGLAELDRPFTDFFRAYDAWRGGRPAVSVAAAAALPVAPQTAYQPTR